MLVLVYQSFLGGLGLLAYAAIFTVGSVGLDVLHIVRQEGSNHVKVGLERLQPLARTKHVRESSHVVGHVGQVGQIVGIGRTRVWRGVAAAARLLQRITGRWVSHLVAIES